MGCMATFQSLVQCLLPSGSAAVAPSPRPSRLAQDWGGVWRGAQDGAGGSCSGHWPPSCPREPPARAQAEEAPGRAGRGAQAPGRSWDAPAGRAPLGVPELPPESGFECRSATAGAPRARRTATARTRPGRACVLRDKAARRTQGVEALVHGEPQLLRLSGWQRRPTDRKVVSSIPGLGVHLGGGFEPPLGPVPRSRRV